MDSRPALAEAAGACRRCGTQLPGTLLSCPSCQSLVHAATLKELAAEAEALEAGGQITPALARWRDALELLPPSSQQYTIIAERVSLLSRRLDDTPRLAAPGGAGSSAGRAWALVAAAVVFLLTKAKLLLLGLTKLKTLLSMLAFLGVYWQLWGWKFAAGLVVSIYIHEMGHVAALARYGIRAGAPMFIPGIGAFVRLKQLPTDARQDARVGLAGPVWGLGAALLAYGLYLVTRGSAWAAIAHTGAILNLFNLAPVWQLDGSRGFRSLSRGQRWIATGALVAAWYATSQPLIALLAIAAVVRAFGKGADEPDREALALYVGLVAALSMMSTIHVQTALVR